MTELDRIRNRYPSTKRFTLDILGVRFAVRTNDEGVANGLARYFAPYVSSDGIPDAPSLDVLRGDPVFDAARLRDVGRAGTDVVPKEAFYDTEGGRVVLKRRTGLVIYVAEPDHVVVGDVIRNLNQAVNAVNMVFAKAMMRRGYVMLHASAVLGPSGGLGFAAPSGAGKSTMALAFVEQGYRFATNDRLLVRSSLGRTEMAGLPKLPRVNPGTLLKLPGLRTMMSSEDRKRYEQVSPSALWTLEEKRDVDVENLFGHGTRQLAGILRTLYFLRWDRDGEGLDVRSLGKGPRLAALRWLVKGLGVYDLQPPSEAAQEAALEAVANAIAAYEVVGRADVLGLRTFILSHHTARASGAAGDDAPPARRGVEVRIVPNGGRPYKEDRTAAGKGLPQGRRFGEPVVGKERAVSNRETFDRDLQGLQEDLLHLGAVVQTAVRRSVEALETRSVAKADEVIRGDDATDALHIKLEEQCMRLMATQQPMAKDLRMIAAVWAMSIDLERVGDHAEDIARTTKRIAEQPLLKPLIDIPRMANLVVEMLREGLDAFVARDAQAAERMARKDDEVDHLYAQVFRELLTYMLEDPRNTQRATYLLMVAQALERVGDHATNIAERVIFMVTGVFKELNA